VSFGVYVALEHFGGSTISNAYSGTQYYSVIFLVGYLFLRGPLGLPSPASYIEIAIILSLYALSAFTFVYIAAKKGITPKPK